MRTSSLLLFYIMDDTLNLTDNKDTVLAQIDALHEQHRLQKLRELINENYISVNLEEDSVDAMIDLLWSNWVTIPPELTYGEPYDSAFLSFIRKYRSSPPNVPIYYLLRYADQLPMFLIYCLEGCHQNLQAGQIELIRSEIWSKLPILSNSGRLISSWELQTTLKNKSLSRLDLVYIAVMLDELYVLPKYLNLRLFVMACKRTC